MPDLLDRIQQEIRAHLDASRAAVEEYKRLEEALTALGGPQPDPPQNPRGGAGTAAGRRPRSGAVRTRAPRGANREAVLRVVRERPGVTTSELAAASGVQKRSLYTLVSTLTKNGELERQELPGGQTGYRIRADPV